MRRQGEAVARGNTPQRHGEVKAEWCEHEATWRKESLDVQTKFGAIACIYKSADVAKVVGALSR